MSDHEDIVEDLREPYQAMRFSKAEIADHIEQLQSDLAAAQATIEAVKAWHAYSFPQSWELNAILSRTDGAALEQVKADTWDEGHRHCFHVDPPSATGNPYRREGGTE